MRVMKTDRRAVTVGEMCRYLSAAAFWDSRWRHILHGHVSASTGDTCRSPPSFGRCRCYNPQRGRVRSSDGTFVSVCGYQLLLLLLVGLSSWQKSSNNNEMFTVTARTKYKDLCSISFQTKIIDATVIILICACDIAGRSVVWKSIG